MLKIFPKQLLSPWIYRKIAIRCGSAEKNPGNSPAEHEAELAEFNSTEEDHGFCVFTRCL
jgi:hypothetical protein